MRCVLSAVLMFMAASGSIASEGEAKAEELRIPAGCRAVEGTATEPYSGSGWAKEVIHEKTGIVLVFIPAGEFKMGAPVEEKGRRKDEGPVHNVKITRPFYMGKYEVTQKEWTDLAGSNPSGWLGEKHAFFKRDERHPFPPEVTPDKFTSRPVERVSWDDCRDFCQTAGGLRLPTEAEWEYACRAGTSTPFAFGEELLTTQANYSGAFSSLDKRRYGQKRFEPIPAGSLGYNAWGLYDMHGNVIEWCADKYDELYYFKSPETDPQGGDKGDCVSARGGSFNSDGQFCRSAQRWYFSPRERNQGIGLRVALDATR